MSTCRLLSVAAALAVIAGPATAQQVISEPGYCAFFYPNANCQNKGPGNPYTGDYQRRLSQGNAIAGADPTAGVVRKRSRASTPRVQ
ncbi:MULTISPECIES: hypothetical protein [Bradyrhizobium]|jgi:hypothetical protein|uniref:Uncharacterized protein n=2 Tax=Bradyrhizobium TaxID=374 RepID=A0ABY0QFB6_9BRAD|nr:MULTISPECIES: hypothetical protein [Bradyrhizobium]SDK15642.1 hypothetical protein SAMN05444163_7380 [Bradyrhizobium ottawaense]SEE50043.1 hypothetical protein SAMN05444171_7751 [Bradyrhizobium lablabi]SHM51029.1 hypothetical protein SAMN05444321_6579 [Bradyrhizobium lablabi]